MSAKPLGGFQQVYPAASTVQQAAYERLLQVAAEVFERSSVWSKTQSSLQQLQVSRAYLPGNLKSQRLLRSVELFCQQCLLQRPAWVDSQPSAASLPSQ